MPEFTPALPKPCKWSVGDNRFDEDGKSPKSLTLFIPLDSVHALCNHLMTMADIKELHKDGKVWNYETYALLVKEGMSPEDAMPKANQSVKGIYLNCKGKDGEYGAYGNINPKKIAQELPF